MLDVENGLNGDVEMGNMWENEIEMEGEGELLKIVICTEVGVKLTEQFINVLENKGKGEEVQNLKAAFLETLMSGKHVGLVGVSILSFWELIKEEIKDFEVVRLPEVEEEDSENVLYKVKMVCGEKNVSIDFCLWHYASLEKESCEDGTDMYWHAEKERVETDEDKARGLTRELICSDECSFSEGIV